MTVISKRVFRPMGGKAGLAHERIKRLAGVITRAGARVRVASVIWGDGARDIHIYASFANMEAAGKAAAAMNADPDFAAQRNESEADPASYSEGPEMWRTVFGEPQPTFPVILQREYTIDRRRLASAVALLPEVQALRSDRPVIGVVPVLSGDMARIMIGYYAKSLADLGESIDSVGMSEAFQAIMLRAAEFGSLTKARAIVNT